MYIYYNYEECPLAADSQRPRPGVLNGDSDKSLLFGGHLNTFRMFYGPMVRLRDCHSWICIMIYREELNRPGWLRLDLVRGEIHSLTQTLRRFRNKQKKYCTRVQAPLVASVCHTIKGEGSAPKLELLHTYCSTSGPIGPSLASMPFKTRSPCRPRPTQGAQIPGDLPEDGRRVVRGTVGRRSHVGYLYKWI